VSQTFRLATHRAIERSRFVTDPLSGFFALRPEVVRDVALRPDGYKILLEVLVRGSWSRVDEVPFNFAARQSGGSKSTFKEGVRFFRHLWNLRKAKSYVQPPARANNQEPLRVLVLTSEVPPVVSGFSRAVTMVSEGLRRRGHHVDIVSRADFPGLLVHEFRFSGFGFFWPSFRKKLANYDVVNVHGPIPTMTEVFLVLMRALPLYRRPGIVYTHHCDISLPGMARLCRWYNRAIEGLAHGADSIVVTSPDYFEKLTRHRGTPVRVIPWAASAAPGPPRTPPTPGRLRVLFVGQLRPYKGLAHLLSAVSGAAELELTIIGDGPMRAELEFRLRQEGLDNVRLLGRVPEDVLERSYASADVIALPSTTTAEAFGIVLIEGMQAGCVPVASDLPGVRTVAGPTGILVRPNDAGHLRTALRDLASDPARLKRLSEASLERARAHGVDQMVEGYEEVLRQAAGRFRAQQELAVTRAKYRDARSFLTDVSQALGPGATASVSLIDLRGDRDHARTWHQDRNETPIGEAPVASYVARGRRPVLIDGCVADPGLSLLLRRRELLSSVLVPFKVDRASIGVLGVSTDQSSGVVLGRRQLEQVMAFVAEAGDQTLSSFNWTGSKGRSRSGVEARLRWRSPGTIGGATGDDRPTGERSAV
jgi:glycosyltransferase involved in cell wall biosynthesis